MFTTRTDRLVASLSFVVCVLIVLAIPSLFGALGAVEFVFALVLALPMTIFLSRRLRMVLARRNHPA